MKIKKPKYTWQFYRKMRFSILPNIIKTPLLWKDKFNSPRCEKSPSLVVSWLFWEYYGQWGDDEYWEQKLWLDIYCDGDYDKAKKEWGWVDMDTDKSTWDDSIILKK